MKNLSIRHNFLSCRAGIETPSGGGSVGISTSVRKFWRKHFQNVQGMQGSNDQVNYMIALDYAGAEPIHRFILRSGEPAEIRKSHSFYYIAAIRKTKRHDIIVIQPTVKQTPDEIRKSRMSEDWLDKVYKGEIKRGPRASINIVSLQKHADNTDMNEFEQEQLKELESVLQSIEEDIAEIKTQSPQALMLRYDLEDYDQDYHLSYLEKRRDEIKKEIVEYKNKLKVTQHKTIDLREKGEVLTLGEKNHESWNALVKKVQDEYEADLTGILNTDENGWEWIMVGHNASCQFFIGHDKTFSQFAIKSGCEGREDEDGMPTWETRIYKHSPSLSETMKGAYLGHY